MNTEEAEVGGVVIALVVSLEAAPGLVIENTDVSDDDNELSSLGREKVVNTAELCKLETMLGDEEAVTADPELGMLVAAKESVAVSELKVLI